VLQLFHFLDRSTIPLRFLTTEEVTANNVNHVFLVHQQDHLLVVWLLGSMTTPILTKMLVGYALPHKFGEITGLLCFSNLCQNHQIKDVIEGS